MSQPPRIVIIGRPNVGKSTLFNRLFGRRRALVHDMPGVTRDRLEEEATWWVKGREAQVILTDTGGLGGDRFAEEIEGQVKTALGEADLILMLWDGQVGLTPLDDELILKLQQSGVLGRIPALGVVNKVDAESHEDRVADFYASGLDPIVTISAEHGRGIEDLQEAILELLPSAWKEGKDLAPEEGEKEEGETEGASEGAEMPKVLRIAVVGRPNVGKSTLINAILREKRMITSPIAGTTVDAVDSEVLWGDRPYVFIDTAGIRRKSKTEQGVEVLSVVQTRKALERCDLAILVMDGESGVTDQDEKIGGLIEEVGCSVILVVNKWDTQRGNKDFGRDEAAEVIREKMAYLRYAPLLFMSAKQGRGIDQLPDLIDEILAQRKVKVLTHEFTEWVRAKSEIHNPMNARFYLCHQSGRNPPTFVCHVNHPDKVHFSLRRHLVNGIREKWGYMGSPIRLLFVEGHKATR